VVEGLLDGGVVGEAGGAAGAVGVDADVDVLCCREEAGYDEGEAEGEGQTHGV
jgi:hypothetical protein